MRDATGVRVRQARFEDHAAIAALEASQELKPKSFADWSRLWAGNPRYRELAPDWPIGWVLENGDKQIVGSLGNLPLSYVLAGQPLLVATGRAWAVDHRYRSYALLLMDRYFDQPAVDVFLNTTVNAQASEAFDVFGSQRVPVGDWSKAAFFVTRYRGFAETALRVRKVSPARILGYPAGLALCLKDLVTARAVRRPKLEVERVNEFDERFDVFWDALRCRSRAFLAVRDRASLAWHFSAFTAQDRPAGDRLWIFTISEGRTLTAYGIFQRRDEPVYGLTRMRLVDFQALSSPRECCQAIVRRALDECKAQGIQVLERVGCDLPRTAVIDELAPYRRKLAAWQFFYLAKKSGLPERFAVPSAWEPSSFDGDSSL